MHNITLKLKFLYNMFKIEYTAIAFVF